MAADLSRAALLYRSGPARDFPLPEAEAIVGYGGGAAVRVPMEGVSRQHAKISFDGKDYWIEDAGSSNGTFLNGVRVTRRERLRHLDVVALGRYTDLIFVRKTGETPRTTRNGIKAASLEALDGAEAGTRWPIPRGSVTIGRAPSNNVVSDSQLVSKIHARLECTGVNLVLTDLHSNNGTFVDGEKIVEARILKDGDEFILGGTRRFRVRIEEGPIETSGIAPLPALARSDPSLPMDWKTRLEWSPEEIASLEHARQVARPAESARREAAPPSKPAARPAVPAGAEGKQPAPAAPQKAPPVKPAAQAPAEVKPAPPAPQPVAHVPAKPAAPARAEVKKPTDSAQPPASAASPEAAAPVPHEPPAPASPRPMDAAPAKPAAAVPPKSAPSRPAAEHAAAAASEKARVEPAPVPPPVAKPALPGPEIGRADASAPPPPVPRTTDVGEATRVLPLDAASKPRVYFEGNLEGKDLLFALAVGDHVVGRVPEVDVHLAGSEVSRRHAIIRVGLSDVTVEDLGSRNGTFVNRERITAPRRLKEGDVVHFGDIPMRVRLSGD